MPSVCMADPGYPVDLTISSDVASLYAVWLGRMPLPVALRAGRVTVQGPSAVTRHLGEVLQLSQVAPFVAASA